MTFAGFVPVRQLVLVDLLGLIMGTKPGERAVVGIDGAATAGRSHVAAELVALAERLAGRQVVRVEIDGFTAADYVSGPDLDTWEDEYHRRYDYAAFRRRTLLPFRAGIEVCPAVYDVASEASVLADAIEPSADAVLLVDGAFLHRPELNDAWDASVYVDGATPDVGSAADDAQAAAHRFYGEQSPSQQATWVLDNTTTTEPIVLWGAEVGPSSAPQTL